MSAGSIDLSELDTIARDVQAAADNASFAAAYMAHTHQTGDTSKARDAFLNARAARDAADAALRRLLALGVNPPGKTAHPKSELRLDQLDTPVARAFLAALEQAAEAGAQLDRERGWVDEEGEPVGHGETLAGMALQMRTEIHGPDTGGRE